ncbi:MAG: PAS domain S-box protein [Nocardioidaceae bacterium]
MGLTSSATGHGSFEVRLPPQPSSVAEARAHVRRLLGATGREDLLETAVLLTSEVVTNALLHAGTDIDVGAVLDDAGLRIEIGDGSPHLPSRRRYAATAGTGRGLLMLEALVDDWGVSQHRGGKTVWFRVSGPDNDLPDLAAPRTDQPGAPGRGRDNVSVELRNMPLLLHAAWQEHAEALLREYLLASLDSDDGDPIQMHADATDAIAVLEEHVPRASVTMSADELMNDAVEPRVSATLIQIPVPLGSVAHFDTLDRAIEAALDLSREGLVLTPPTQPEVQEFRRWICRQVLIQAAGQRAEPWRTPEDALGPEVVIEGWDPSPVTEAATGLIAADATSRILAVSRQAAAILGYGDGSELVGRRIVTIVPERYRQAHVAGFTMYLLVGRKPLLDRPVVVPALRRDGSEVEVELTVRAPAAGNGQSVLLADIRLIAD